MKLAKANAEDLKGATDLLHILSAVSQGYMPDGMEAVHEDAELFDIDDSADCKMVLKALIEIENGCNLLRVVWGMETLMDPLNDIIDPESETLDLHPSIAEALALKEKIDSFKTQPFTGGMKFKLNGEIYDLVSADFEQGLVAYNVDYDEDLKWARWENVELIEEQEGAA